MRSYDGRVGFFKRLFGRDYEVQSYTPPASTASARTVAPGAAPSRAMPSSPGFQGQAATAGSAVFVVEDVFTITGRGVVAVGEMRSGFLAARARVRVMRAGHPMATATVTGAEVLRRRTERVEAGQRGGLLLAGIQRQDVQAGDEIVPERG